MGDAPHPLATRGRQPFWHVMARSFLNREQDTMSDGCSVPGSVRNAADTRRPEIGQRNAALPTLGEPKDIHPAAPSRKTDPTATTTGTTSKIRTNAAISEPIHSMSFALL